MRCNLNKMALLIEMFEMGISKTKGCWIEPLLLAVVEQLLTNPLLTALGFHCHASQ
ncbi:Uncharacterised protein [Vibrio cholerae]|nr:Uncharacterised protein [Vibrio cholerae]